MTIVAASNIVCPIDGQDLTTVAQQLCCSQGHSFDIARQAYVNLLLVQDKRSKQPGDSKAMVAARSHFLSLGHYLPIVTYLIDWLTVDLKNTTDDVYCVLDAGCGEGYYLDCIVDAFQDNAVTQQLSFIGIDISKHAVLAAAKKNQAISWLVASNRKPPIANNSVDLITSVFGFQSLAAFNSLLKNNGKLILVEAGPNHLQELREIIYQDVTKTTRELLSAAEQQFFNVVHSETLQFKTDEILNQDINHLLLMTPHFFRASAAAREKARAIKKLKVTIDVSIRVLQKNQDQHI